jgi:hypothetical protein
MSTGYQLAFEDTANLCSYGMRPHLMTGALVQLMRQHFADRQNIEEPSLRDYLWQSADAGNLSVESITRWHPAQSMGRPALVVKRNGWQVQRRGIDDRAMGTTPLDGFDYYATFIMGSHTLFCICSEPAESERLCAEVYRELMQFGPVIRKYLDLHRFTVAEVGPLAKIQEATGSYAVPVSVAYCFEEAWRIAPDTPVLKRISLTALIQSAA